MIVPTNQPACHGTISHPDPVPQVYLDGDYAFCDNALWSDRPLDTAEVLLLVFNQPGSWLENPTGGALIVVARKGSEPFAAFAL